MTIGTKSVLFGAHCFVFHWLVVARAWWRLYGFPFDPRLWLAFVVHDLGYVGSPNMDGPEGERHVYLGAGICGWLLDDTRIGTVLDWVFGTVERHGARTWWGFVAYHSRFIAKRNGQPPSRLCVADKLAIAIVPWWVFLPMARASGELAEYLAKSDAAGGGKYVYLSPFDGDVRAWYAGVQDYLRRWVAAHKDGGEDTWTPRQAS